MEISSLIAAPSGLPSWISRCRSPAVIVIRLGNFERRISFSVLRNWTLRANSPSSALVKRSSRDWNNFLMHSPRQRMEVTNLYGQPSLSVAFCQRLTGGAFQPHRLLGFLLSRTLSSRRARTNRDNPPRKSLPLASWPLLNYNSFTETD